MPVGMQQNHYGGEEETMRNWIVYKHTNKINGKMYIGITGQTAERRWRNQGKGYKKCVAFYRAIEKYGWDNFTHEILFEGLSKEEAEELERKLIKENKSNNPEYGYNIANGGNVAAISDETKEKISKTLKKNYKKENHHNYGKHYDEEFKKKLSEAHKGIQAGKLHPNYGKPMTEVQKEKIRRTMIERGIVPSRKAIEKGAEARRGSKNSEYWCKRIKEVRSLPVLKISLSGEILKRYSSITEAIQDLGKTRSCGSNITAACKGRKKTAYGYIWKYAGD